MNTGQEQKTGPLTIRLKEIPSTLKISPSGEIQFPRAVLAILNTGPDPLNIYISQAGLFQEGGMLQDVTKALNKTLSGRFIPPEDTLQWDLYDLLMTEHPGVSSKVHLFGYKAVLNWRFELDLTVEYRLSAESLPVQTPLYRAKFQWNASKTALGKVALSIEVVST